VSAKLALSVPFACCWLSCFYAIVFYEQINDYDDDSCAHAIFRRNALIRNNIVHWRKLGHVRRLFYAGYERRPAHSNLTSLPPADSRIQNTTVSPEIEPSLHGT